MEDHADASEDAPVVTFADLLAELTNQVVHEGDRVELSEALVSTYNHLQDLNLPPAPAA